MSDQRASEVATRIALSDVTVMYSPNIEGLMPISFVPQSERKGPTKEKPMPSANADPSNPANPDCSRITRIRAKKPDMGELRGLSAKCMRRDHRTDFRREASARQGDCFFEMVKKAAGAIR